MPNSYAELNVDLFDLAKRYAAKAKEVLGDQIVSVALFGSVARGQAGPGSDINLFVVLLEASSGMLSRRRLLDPVRQLLTPELERFWKQGIYVDFVEVIRTRSEARKFHPLYLDMSREAILLYDRDRFLETLLAMLKKQLERDGAERKVMGNFWYWDLSGSSIPEEAAVP
jgi:hypothetical protein